MRKKKKSPKKIAKAKVIVKRAHKTASTSITAQAESPREKIATRAIVKLPHTHRDHETGGVSYWHYFKKITAGILTALGGVTIILGSAIINLTRLALRGHVAPIPVELAQAQANKLGKEFELSEDERLRAERAWLRYFNQRKELRRAILEELKNTLPDDKYRAIEAKMNRWQRWIY
ncbi:MAG: hypothetical protein QM529_06275 [Hydrotalea sp.]|nr:hypothetical protein [Hydrotalea sp.]